MAGEGESELAENVYDEVDDIVSWGQRSCRGFGFAAVCGAQCNLSAGGRCRQAGEASLDVGQRGG